MRFFVWGIMAIIIAFIIFFLFLNTNRNLLLSSNDTMVDLKNKDSIRVYLNGYWIKEQYIKKELYGEKFFLLRLNFGKNYVSEFSFFNPNEMENDVQHPSFAEIHINQDSTFFKIVHRMGSHKHQIKYLSKNKLILDSIVYFRHKPPFQNK